MSSNKDALVGAAVGLGLFVGVLVGDMTTDKFNMVDHFNSETVIGTESAYRILFMALVAGGAIGGDGLGSRIRNSRNAGRRLDGYALA